jgi:hypothetical protein
MSHSGVWRKKLLAINFCAAKSSAAAADGAES